MRAVIQRASSASLHIKGKLHASIGTGFVVLLGIHIDDSPADVEYLVGKILLISQFTLYADTRKGNRPSYLASARPEQAIPLYELMIEKLSSAMGAPIQTGVFGADMQVSLCNDGPVTIIIDSKTN